MGKFVGKILNEFSVTMADPSPALQPFQQRRRIGAEDVAQSDSVQPAWMNVLRQSERVSFTKTGI